RHAATAAAATRAADEAATAATRAATEAATVTTEATTIAAAEATTAAAAKTVTAAEAVVATAHEGVEALLAEPVALVSAPAATSSVKTHKPEITFASPVSKSHGGVDEAHHATGQPAATAERPSPLHFGT
ncbi:MAG TPA: hypothetical protein VN222_12490, partial [Novosphingobium sp.]|nr:hypothetical protein [Novosphingobium sp.]